MERDIQKYWREQERGKVDETPTEYQIYFPDKYPPRFRLRFRPNLVLHAVPARKTVGVLSDFPVVLCMGTQCLNSQMRVLAASIALVSGQKQCNPFRWIAHKEAVPTGVYWNEDMPYGMPGVVPWQRAYVNPLRDAVVWEACTPPDRSLLRSGNCVGLIMAMPDLHGVDTLDAFLNPEGEADVQRDFDRLFELGDGRKRDC